MLPRSVERTEASIQGLRPTLLRLKWHLLQLGRRSLQPLSLRRKLVLSVVQVVLVFSTLSLLERQEAVVRFALASLNTVA